MFGCSEDNIDPALLVDPAFCWSHKNKAGNELVKDLAFSCILTSFSLIFSSPDSW